MHNNITRNNQHSACFNINHPIDMHMTTPFFNIIDGHGSIGLRIQIHTISILINQA